MVLNIVIQEALRPLIYKALAYCCKKLNAVQIPLSITQPSELFKLSVCVGMGNGFLNILTVYLLNYLWLSSALVTLTSSGSAADYYIPQCGCISIYVLTAVESLCVMPMHVAWCYFTLRSYSKSYTMTAILILLWHLAEGGIVGNDLIFYCRQFWIKLTMDVLQVWLF